MEKLVLFHTNDLHSHLENWPKIRRYIKKQRSFYEENGSSVLLVDLGDFVDRWHPLSEATKGKANIELLNEMNYDAITIGNNEGVGNSKEELNHLYDELNTDVLLANLADKETLNPPEWAKEFKIIETEKGLRIGLFALTAVFPLTYEPNGWKIYQAEEILKQLIPKIRQQCDCLIFMSHLGIDEDVKIANQFPEIDILLGAHTHHLFPNGEKVNGVWLCAAGKFGQYIGEVHLIFEEKRLVDCEIRTVATSELPELAEDEREILSYMEKGHQLLQEKKVGKLPATYFSELNQTNALMDLALEAVKEQSKTEVAILNSGLLLGSLPKGIIDEDQLHQILPHPMHLIRIRLKGIDFIRMIHEMEKNRHFLRKFPIMGMGFRGKIFGDICYAGITYDQESKQVFWQESKIEPEQFYTFATVDHFQFVPFFPTIELVGETEFLFPDFIRTVLKNYLSTHYPIN